jgi:hypothetical protein
MERARQRSVVPRRSARWGLVLGICLAALAALLPASASAACAPEVRADSLATQQVLAELEARGAAGAADVRGVYERARRSCLDIRPARAFAQALAARGIQPAGRRAVVLGVDLVSVEIGGATSWRVDLARTAQRASAARTVRERRRALATLESAAWGTSATTYSADPTRLAWDPGAQSAVAAILARSPRAEQRSLADAAVRAYGVGRRSEALAREPVLTHLRIATRLVAAATAQSPRARSIARSATLRAYTRVRAAATRGWSRLDGAWSTAPQHRLLTALTASLLDDVPHAPTATVAARLRAGLTSPPAVTFETLPSGAFYPWPRDGAFDQQSVVIDVDKPAALALLVYGASGALVRRIPATTEPGSATLSWDGARADGTILGPGDYRYNIEARDPLGNRIRVPGLQQLRIARDTTPATVVAASARIVGSGQPRRVIASWDVDEVHSPMVRSWLVLRDGERRASIALHDSLQQATVRRDTRIESGTWRATMVFIDGSGNRSQRLVGTFTIR